MTLHQPAPDEPTRKVRIAPSSPPPPAESAVPGDESLPGVPPPAEAAEPGTDTLPGVPPPAAAATPNDEALPGVPPPAPPAETAPRAEQTPGGLLQRFKRRLKG